MFGYIETLAQLNGNFLTLLEERLAPHGRRPDATVRIGDVFSQAQLFMTHCTLFIDEPAAVPTMVLKVWFRNYTRGCGHFISLLVLFKICF